MKKPTVNFKGDAVFYTRPLPNQFVNEYGKYMNNDGHVTYAHIYALNHPYLGEDIVRTSIVLKRYKNGNFETLNTKYKKVLDKNI